MTGEGMGAGKGEVGPSNEHWYINRRLLHAQCLEARVGAAGKGEGRGGGTRYSCMAVVV